MSNYCFMTESYKLELAQCAVVIVDVHILRTAESLQNDRCDVTEVVLFFEQWAKSLFFK